ncbi:MAG: helix-turn-helix domain-containing protein [Proteobacteria bacterium]|nr:helix-turn-helix domain-containing protein [Pseudomonadota bacterium]
MGVTMGTSLKIRDDLTPLELRRWARKEARGWPAGRAYAIANALEGMSRAEAARRAGMARQALRDAVLRYNAEGLSGLYDRPQGGPPRRLTQGEEAALAAVILEGPGARRRAPPFVRRAGGPRGFGPLQTRMARADGHTRPSILENDSHEIWRSILLSSPQYWPILSVNRFGGRNGNELSARSTGGAGRLNSLRGSDKNLGKDVRDAESEKTS